MTSSPTSIPVTFSCAAKGYESRVTVDAADPERAGALVSEWLEFHLQTLRPGETLTVVCAPLGPETIDR